MSRSFRVTWLSVMALLAPCVVIGALAYQWLALEREAAAHRGVEGARAAIASATSDMVVELAAVAGRTLRVLEARTASVGPFAPMKGLPALVQDAFLFDSDGRLSELSRQSPGDAVRASALLAEGRSSSPIGATREVAAQIIACCPGARDEYGVSFALYAIWQRVTATLSGRDDAAVARAVRDVGDLINRGYLGEADDEAEIRLLANRTAGRGGFGDLLSEIHGVRAEAEHRAARAKVAGEWLSRAGTPEVGRAVRLGLAGPAGTVMLLAATEAGDDPRLVLALDQAALADWIRQWSSAHPTFQVGLERASTASGIDVETLAGSGSTALVLFARSQPSDSATDRRRETLFLGAIGAAVALTLVVGFLAVRDVSRELRLARLQSTFVAGVTHELKTPLTSIRLLAETLRQGRARPEQSAELLDTIAQEAERVGRMIDNVLSSSRIESGTRVYSRQAMVVQEVVNAAVSRFDYVLRSEGFRIVRAFDDAPIRVLADAEAFEQAVLNLLGNAVKYSAGSPSKEIRIAVAVRGLEAEVRVADDGIGVSPADASRIFDRFYRGPDVRSQTAGAGLGLSLVQHFVHAHGGRVIVESQSGQGSAFSLWLPIARA